MVCAKCGQLMIAFSQPNGRTVYRCAVCMHQEIR